MGETEVAFLAAEVRADDVVVLQLEVPLAAVRAAAAVARAAGTRVVLNAAPAAALIGQALPEVDLLVVKKPRRRRSAASWSTIPIPPNSRPRGWGDRRARWR